MEAAQNQITDKRARTAQACQSCRILKARCLPSTVPGICQRCRNFNRECHWVETGPRAKRRQGPSRISQVERKIDGLVARFTDNGTDFQSRPSTRPSPSSTLQSHRQQQSHAHNLLTPASDGLQYGLSDGIDHRVSLTELEHIHDFDRYGTREKSFNYASSVPRQEDELANDIEHIIADADAESLLDDYRSMSASLPFVPIAPEITASDMRKQKPILLLAVLAAASGKDRGLQATLEENYRQELAKRALIEPWKNVSLVQSIMVYLAWLVCAAFLLFSAYARRYHFYFNHKIQNIYPILQLGVGLVTEISPYLAAKQGPFLSRPRARLSPQQEREEQRTILGCYYLSSAISSALQKSNLFKYTDYMSGCLKRLQDDLEFTSDRTLTSLIVLRRLDDEMQHLCHSAGLDSSQRLLGLQNLETKLTESKAAYNEEENPRLLDLLFHYSIIELHSFKLGAQSGSIQSTSDASGIQLSTVYSCADAGKSFLDTLLECPVSDYRLISFTEWIRLPQVILTLAKISVGYDDNTSWSVSKPIQDHVRLGLYLESLCYRMQTLTTFKPPSQPRPDFWMAIKIILDKIREWYIRQIRSNTDVPKRGPPAAGSAFAVPNQHIEQNDAQRIRENANLSYDLPDASTASDLEWSVPTGDAGDRTPLMPHEGFDLDDFIHMDFWGGPESYDPTIERNSYMHFE